MFCISSDEFALVIEARNAPVRSWFTKLRSPVPDDLSSIEIAIDDPESAPLAVGDRARVPFTSTWRWNVFAVEINSNCTRRLTQRVFLKDPSNDGSFRRDYLPFSRNRLSIGTKLFDDRVSIGEAGRDLSRFHSASLATAHFLFHVVEIELVHDAFEADVENADISFRQRGDPNAKELHLPVKVCGIALVTRQTIQRFG
nr:hypothetical protein [Henriciella pelagia]